jgi:phosphate acyltransferase
MRIGIDIMGGDYAPLETTLGAILAFKELPADVKIVLLGDKPSILPVLKENNISESAFEIIHTTEVIDMSDAPTKAFTQKPDSSLAVGFKMMKERKLDGFASAGNTGAMMVGAMFSVKTIPGILRPCISSIIPKEHGGIGIILDVGINADCKPEILQQFALLGSLLAEYVYHIPGPKVGLMNIGEEEEKGNLLTQTTHQLLKATKEINFIGNIEGRDLFNDKADVIVCDGFTGNVILKQAESFYSIIRKRNIKDEYLNRFNYENYGGTPLLGVNSTVMIAHGISNAKAIKNMIVLMKEVVEVKLNEKIANALSITSES